MSEGQHLIRIARNGQSSDTAITQLDLGARVRELRKARGWTLEQAAVEAGLARSTMSKIENGQMSPTYEALKKLAGGLAISVPQLFTPPSQNQVMGRMAVTKLGGGQAHPTTTYEHELLAAGLVQKKMLPYRATIRARSFDDFDGWVRHDGEEFLLILKGQAEVILDDERIFLDEGDAVYFDATLKHRLLSYGGEETQVLAIVTR